MSEGVGVGLQVSTITLNDGNEMPMLGLGSAIPAPEGIPIYITALEVGYRHFDTAWVYNSQTAIGEAVAKMIAARKVERKDVFITSKIWNTFHHKENVLKNCQDNLQQLKVDYIDLLLVHWPIGLKEDGLASANFGEFSDVDYLETWQGMEECKDRGWAKSIGVSNFNVKQLERLLSHCKIRPAVNQVEMHPFLSQTDLLNFCKENKIAVTAYSPLGAPYDRTKYGSSNADDPTIFNEPVLKEIADANNKSVAQVTLRWAIQRNVVVVPRTASTDRMKENLQIFSFELNDEDMKKIDALNRNWKAYPLLQWKDHPYYPF